MTSFADLAQEDATPAAGSAPPSPPIKAKARFADLAAEPVPAAAAPSPRINLAQASEANDGPGAGLLQVGAHAVTSAGSYLAGLARAGGAMLGGGTLDDAADEVQATHDKYTYQPPAGSRGAAMLGAMESKYSPLSWLANATGALGDKTLQVTGSPLLATIADVGTNGAVTMGAGKLLGAGGLKAKEPEAATVSARAEPTATPTQAAVTADPSPSIVPPQPQTGATVPPQAAAPGFLDPALRVPEPTSTPIQTSSRPIQAANDVSKPTISDAANGVFAESNPDVAGGLSDAAQARRAQVLQDIGLQTTRTSAVTGDTNQAAVDFQTSRLKGSPGGDAMSQQLATEKQTIADYADNIAQQTGGSALNDQSAKLARGEAILTPLEGLKEWFDNQTSALYKTADERAQGVPTQLDNFRSVLGDDSLATNSDRVNLRTAASAYAKKLGIIDDQGNVFANAQQAETMRKYLNENWSPQNSGLVGKLKDALDTDVMQAAGEDVYAQARALRAQRAATLDNPNGIAKLLDSSGPQGVNRAVPVEKVADTLTNMPVAQLSNIVNTLKNVPPELQPMAQDALSEIKAQYAHNVSDIGGSQQGQWNAKGVQKYLSNNSARMQTVFAPEEMQKFGTLNDAGNILAKDQSYPGAFAQKQNLLRAGVTHAISTGATAGGAAIAGPIGGALGSVLGGKLAGKFNDAATLRAVQGRMTKLSDLIGPPAPATGP